MTSFWVMDGSAQTAHQTSVHALYDGTALYLAVQCAENVVDKIKAEQTGRDEFRAWRDDSVEIFIAPDATKPDWVHLLVTAGGATYDKNGGGRRFDFDMRFNHKFSIGPSSWMVEAAIGLDSLSLGQITPGHVMNFNVCRNRTGKPEGGERTCWSPTGASFANRDRFSDLVIGTFGAQQAEIHARLARSLTGARRVHDQVDQKTFRTVEAVSLISSSRQPIPDQQWQVVRDAMLDAERRLRMIALQPRGTVLWAPNTWAVPMPEDLPPTDDQDVEAIEM